MSDKKSRTRQTRSTEKREARRKIWIRLVLIGFSIILILSLVLSLAATTT
ncbi:MAG TPA: hypothetical protein VK888_04605 [Anaerolineales bacterium]|nr:hypothetical protein [Anaerolineales bacterium]